MLRLYSDTHPVASSCRSTTTPANNDSAAAKSQWRSSQPALYSRPECTSPTKHSARLRSSRKGYCSRCRRSAASKRSCNSAALAHWPGSAQRLPVPCERSTTPFSCGRRGRLCQTATPSPASHNSSAVGSPPLAPQGVPLSVRSRAGRPQRPNATRRNCWVFSGGTCCQERWGENSRLQERTAVLLDRPQPADFRAVVQWDILAGIQLPAVVGGSCPRTVAARRPARGRGLQARGAEVSLQGTRTGERLGGLLPQDDAHVGCAPGRVLPAQVERSGTGRGAAATVLVAWSEAIGVAAAQLLPQAPHRTRRQTQLASDLRG